MGRWVGGKGDVPVSFGLGPLLPLAAGQVDQMKLGETAGGVCVCRGWVGGWVDESIT